MPSRESDWLGFFVRFICGAAFGAVAMLGFYCWSGNEYDLLWWIIGGAIGFGLASGFFGDEFWKAVGDWGWWG